MARRCSLVLLALLLAACRKTSATSGLDASADASDASDANALLEDAAPPAPVASIAPTATSTAASLAELQGAPLPFTGTYRCFGGMKLEQAGRYVTSTIHKGTTDTVLACTAGGDVCTGTVREIQTVRGRPPKVNHVKPVTLTRSSSGDITYVVGSPDKKAGHGEQTLCQRAAR